MARTRRRSYARNRLNLEIVGIAAVALAVLCGVALALPHSSGAIGGWIAAELRRLFGGAAPLFPVLGVLIGAIVFLEINVPRMIAGLGSSALAYFLIVTAMFGAGGPKRGGLVGANIFWALHALVGTIGAWIVLSAGLLSLTLWLTNASMKQVIGRLIVFFGGLRPPPMPKLPKLNVELPRGHESLREAFALPMAPAASTAVLDVPAAPPFNAPVAVEELAPEPDEVDEELIPPAKPPRPVVSKMPAPLVEAAASGAVTYRLPDLALFDKPQGQAIDDSNRAHVLEDTLASFGVGAKVTHIERGPSITRYELKPERGVKISRIASLADDLALALAATSVRIEAPIPGKSAVGIEIPNKTVSVVAIREILDALPNRGQVPPLWMALGKDITGRPVFGDLCTMPHLLVAGATGAGKSVCLNCIIASLLVCATPDQMQMLMIDPKRVELSVFNGIPHLIKDVIADPRLAAGALFEMTKEMEARYERFAKAGVRKIEEYNTKYPDERLPYVVVVIDELADLMLIARARRIAGEALLRRHRRPAGRLDNRRRARQHEQETGDNEIGERHRRRHAQPVPDADLATVHEAKEGEHGAREREGCGLDEVRDRSRRRRSRPAPGRSESSRRPAPPGRGRARLARRSCRDRPPPRWCRRRRACRRSVACPRRPACGVSASTMAGACLAGVFWNGLRADQHADVEQDRRDGDHRNERQHQRDDAEPGQHDHHDPGRRRIADPAAHRLPARMADVDRVDERIAHQAADQADDAVGGQHARGRIAVAGRRRAFDVVHGLDQIVDAERDRGDQDDAEELEAGEHVADRRDRQREAEVRERSVQIGDAHAAETEAK